MGLMIHSLDVIPANVNKDYYLYLLDYGWKEPLSEVISNNLDKISDLASKNNSVFITGTVGSHVNNEILSWHHINGENGDDILPAILITTVNPHLFRELEFSNKKILKSKMILIPLKKCCKTSTDVISVIRRIFKDINNNNILSEFSVQKEMKKGVAKRFWDGVILQPNFNGVGFDFKKFFK